MARLTTIEMRAIDALPAVGGPAPRRADTLARAQRDPKPDTLALARRAVERARAARRDVASAPMVDADPLIRAQKVAADPARAPEARAAAAAEAEAITAAAIALTAAWLADRDRADQWLAEASAVLRAAEDQALAVAVARDDQALAARVQVTFARARHAFTYRSARGVRRFAGDLQTLAAALDLPDASRALACGAIGQYAHLWRPTAEDRAIAFGERAAIENDAALDAILYASGNWAAAATHDATTITPIAILPSEPIGPLPAVVKIAADRPAGHTPRSAGYLAPILPAKIAPAINDCPIVPRATLRAIATLDPDWI